MPTEFRVNGRTYRPADRPQVVVCLDGSANEYLDEAMVHDLMPNLKGALRRGGRRVSARAVLPSFTNPNNASIVTGVPPGVHGINGNFFLDPQSGREVMMNGAEFLRAGTIPAAAARNGRRVAVVTAKDKLRSILSKDLDGIGFSAERAGEAREATHGIGDVEARLGPAPEIYSADASIYVLQAGAMLLETGKADLLYLSLTDYIQHKHAPEAPEALDFYRRIDEQIGRMIDFGAAIGLTADHGMNAKQTASGEPRVVYLESLLSEIDPGVRVILPITDPYVAHHGALGSFAVIHTSARSRVRTALHGIREITEVFGHDEAAQRLELAPDRLGDFVVMSARDVTIGRRPDAHDLTTLAGPLRSHGGRYEEMVPFLVTEPVSDEYQPMLRGDLRNFDVFEVLLNGTSAARARG